MAQQRMLIQIGPLTVLVATSFVQMTSLLSAQCSMVLQDWLQNVLVTTKYAWIIELCSYMLNLELVILPKTIQRRTSYCNSRVCSFRLDFVVAMLPSNLQPKASLPYGSVGYASSSHTSIDHDAAVSALSFLVSSIISTNASAVFATSSRILLTV